MSEEKIIISFCPKCEKLVRIGTLSEMTTECQKEFISEVVDYNLDVKTMIHNKFITTPVKWCLCEPVK